MSIKSVVLIGANGTLGAPILKALADAQSFNVTVLKRSSSSSSSAYPSGVNVKHVSSLSSKSELTTALEGVDAVVVCFPLKEVDAHLAIAEASAAAGVKRIIPADFGSADSSSKRAQELVGLFVSKTQVRQRLVELALQHEGFTWTSIVTGHFFDWCVKQGYMHVLFNQKKVEMLDDGSKMFSASTLSQIGKATVKVLQKPEETKNKVIYVQSFCISQQDILESLMTVVGGPWDAEFMKSDDFVKYNKEKADIGDTDAVEELVFALGVTEADFTQRKNFAMKLLGLEEEKLDDVIKEIVNDLINEGKIGPAPPIRP